MGDIKTDIITPLAPDMMQISEEPAAINIKVTTELDGGEDWAQHTKHDTDTVNVDPSSLV